MKKLYGVIVNGRLSDVSHSAKALMRRFPARIVYSVQFRHAMVAGGVRTESYDVHSIVHGPESPTISLRHLGKQLSYVVRANA